MNDSSENIFQAIGGCSAKLSLFDLNRLTDCLKDQNEPDCLLTSSKYNEDACIYRANNDLAIISTIDFFPPMINDPFVFGQIAACNALSDIYAKGGQPKIALNVLACPENIEIEIVQKVLQGGLELVNRAGAFVGGGHSIRSNQLIYGLSIIGEIKPENIFYMNNAHLGDKIVLTKPIGTGIGCLALKSDLLDYHQKNELIDSMITLNSEASLIAHKHNVKSATDITGFGLIGHLINLAQASGVAIRLYADKVQVFSGVEELAKDGILPQACYKNRDYFSHLVKFDDNVKVFKQDLLFDPQTSGGLVFAVKSDICDEFILSLKSKNICAHIIAEVIPKLEYTIVVL